MHRELLSNLEKLAGSYKQKKIESQPEPEPDLSKKFKWISDYCDYNFDDNKNLICTNALGKTFKISKDNSLYFRDCIKSWPNNNHVMRVFKNSPFDFKYVTRNIQIQIKDLFLEFNDCEDFRIHGYGTMNPTDTGYEINFTLKKGNCIEWNTKNLTKSLLNEPEKYIAMEINKAKFDPVTAMIINNPLQNLVVQFNKFNIKCPIKPEFNDFIISELGKYALSEDVIKLFKKYEKNINLDAEIHAKTLALIKLIKQKEKYELRKAKIILFTQVKPKFDKCMAEIVNVKKNKNIDIEKEFANINKDPGAIRRFIMIWSTDNFEELQKKCNLKENHLELAKYLYKLDKRTRELKLLENNIYL